MANLTNNDKQKLESLLGMNSGYVLDFSNRTFDDFFSVLNINIYDVKYDIYGVSKANHLRALWDSEPDIVIGQIIKELLEHWRTSKMLGSEDITNREQLLYDESLKIAYRLLKQQVPIAETEEQFLKKEINTVDLRKLNIDAALKSAIEQRIDEINKCITADAPLAVIFLCGSTLEGLLLNVATGKVADFNQTSATPLDKNTQKPKKLHEWTLAQLIDASAQLGILKDDVKKFSHNLRDFRNYIHPHQQALSGFDPSVHTAEICFKVLRLAILQISEVA